MISNLEKKTKTKNIGCQFTSNQVSESNTVKQSLTRDSRQSLTMGLTISVSLSPSKKRMSRQMAHSSLINFDPEKHAEDDTTRPARLIPVNRASPSPC